MTNDIRMVRKQIYLKSQQNETIKLLSNRKGKTEAEIIREAIDRYMVSESKLLEDPIEELIGLIDLEIPEGSVNHDEDIYKLRDEKG